MFAQHAWYDWFGLNTQLFLLVNGLHAQGFDNFMLGVTTLGHPRLFPFYIAAALLWSRARPVSLPPRNVAVFALGYLLTSVLVVPALKSGLDFPRPLQVLGAAAVTLVGRADEAHSLPSGHAAFAVLMAASLTPGSARPMRFALLAFALLVCVSRVSVGAHFPADVLAGALVALALTIVARIAVPDRGRA